MKEKKPKSPVLVVATIMFLAMFIVLPPLFRAYFPEEEEIIIEEVKKEVLSCDRVSILEKYKINVKLSYEDGVPTKNVITYIVYTPTDAEIAAGDTSTADKTVAEELAFFKGIEDVSITESASQITVVIEMDDLINNPDKVELENYLKGMDVTISDLEAQGYTCTKIGL